MIMPALLLQKPHAKSKIQEHITCLQRRLSLWDKGYKGGQSNGQSGGRSSPGMGMMLSGWHANSPV